jgi:NADH-quinone oxidoreductase subunit J
MSQPAEQFVPFLYSMLLTLIIFIVVWQLTKKAIPFLSGLCFYLAILAALFALATPVIFLFINYGHMIFGQFQPYLIFYALSLFILFCAWNVVTRKNLVHAALFLCLTFLGVAGIFILQNAEFLAAVQILIYAGAVTILMLFAIMLSQNIAGHEIKSHNRQAPFVIIATLVLAVVMIISFVRPITLEDGQVVSTGEKWAVQTGVEDTVVAMPNIALIGQSLMSTYTLAFWIVSIILTVAMIGSLIIARKD